MQKTKKHIREAILIAARDEFFQKGFALSSLRTIAAEAGISPGNLYHYFGGKSKLFSAVVSPAFDALTAFSDEHEDEHLQIDLSDIPELIENRTQALARIITRYRKEIYILFSGAEGTGFEELVNNYIKRITDHAADHISASPSISLDKKKTGILAQSMTHSYLAGWLHIIRTATNDDELISLLQYYLKVYLQGPVKLFGYEQPAMP